MIVVVALGVSVMVGVIAWAGAAPAGVLVSVAGNVAVLVSVAVAVLVAVGVELTVAVLVAVGVGLAIGVLVAVLVTVGVGLLSEGCWTALKRTMPGVVAVAQLLSNMILSVVASSAR